MANFSNTSDYVTSVLQLAGETTSSTGPYYAKALEHLNTIHRNVIAGGSEFNLEVDEVWPWARAAQPITMEIVPAIEGSIVVTKNTETVAFTAVPSDDNSSNVSLRGWYLQLDGIDTVYEIGQHTAAGTDAELTTNFVDTSGTYSYTAFKLDYHLAQSQFNVIDNYNSTFYFAETTAKTPITATLTAGVYSYPELATEIQTRMNASGASTYTVTSFGYSADGTGRGKLRFTSNLAGGDGVFYLIGNPTSAAVAYTLEYKSAHELLKLDYTDSADAATHYTVMPYNAIARLSQPIKLHVGQSDRDLKGLEPIAFDNKYPLSTIREGYPSEFSIRRHTQEGQVWIRLNKYPDNRMIIMVDYVPLPLSLYTNTNSKPLIPQQYSDVLNYGAASKLLLEKEDSKWEVYQQKASVALEAMMRNNRKDAKRMNPNFGSTIARPDLIASRHKSLRYGYTAGDE